MRGELQKISAFFSFQPLIKKTVVRVAASPQRKKTTIAASASTPNTQSFKSPSPNPSPSTNKLTPQRMAASNKSASARAPSTNRPSAKQSASIKSAVARDDLQECKYCNRRFLPDRIQVHEDICSKTGKKKRKTYDATKHRLQGTELEPYVKKLSRGQSVKVSFYFIPKYLYYMTLNCITL